MTHRRGRRSPPGKFKQANRAYIFAHSWRDQKIKETVLTKDFSLNDLREAVAWSGAPEHWWPEAFSGLVVSSIHSKVELWDEDKEICGCGAQLREFCLTCSECGAIYPFSFKGTFQQ